MDWDQWIKENLHCCGCSGSLQDSEHINIICLDKLATWKYPSWGNILVHEKYPINRASAILCDRCIQKKQPAKYAVEWNNERTQVKYHSVEDLKDLPQIPDDEILEAESRLRSCR